MTLFEGFLKVCAYAVMIAIGTLVAVVILLYVAFPLTQCVVDLL